MFFFVGRHFRVQLVREVLAMAAPEVNGRTENGKPAWCLGAKVGWRRPEEEGLVSLAAARAVGGQGGPPSDPTI